MRYVGNVYSHLLVMVAMDACEIPAIFRSKTNSVITILNITIFFARKVVNIASYATNAGFEIGPDRAVYGALRTKRRRVAVTAD